jgi:GNAT superfamily N-acetyltransferase
VVEALAADLIAELAAWTASTPQARHGRHLGDIADTIENATWNADIEVRVATLDGHRVGLAVTRASGFAGAPSTFVWWVAVDAALRRSGVGRALVAAVEDDGCARGRILEGLVSADDPAAVAFWTALGWRPSGSTVKAPWIRDPCAGRAARAGHPPVGEQ